METQYALSIKQPWAALLVHGLKAVEVRRWPTARRGRVLIHAARVADDRPTAWERVPLNIMPTTKLRGGILGAAELTGCVTYRSAEEFVRDEPLHLNAPDWFEGPALYGFVFSRPEALPFRRYPGWLRFFAVDLSEPPAADRPHEPTLFDR